MAAIATPQFGVYRRRGLDSVVKSDVKNMATAQEAYFMDKSTYSAFITDLTPRGYKQSANVGAASPSASATTFYRERYSYIWLYWAYRRLDIFELYWPTHGNALQLV